MHKLYFPQHAFTHAIAFRGTLKTVPNILKGKGEHAAILIWKKNQILAENPLAPPKEAPPGRFMPRRENFKLGVDFNSDRSLISTAAGRGFQQNSSNLLSFNESCS